MREIKFRAWDLDLLQMKRVLSVEWLEEMYVTYWNEPEVARANTVLMQYTGLKDKNGKEIYEGEILSDDGTEGGIIAYIDFCDKCFSYQYFYDGVCHSCDGNFQLVDYPSEGIEIIGNIYENPELIK